MRDRPNDLARLVRSLNSEEMRACIGHLKQYESKYREALLALLHCLRQHGTDVAAQKKCLSAHVPENKQVYCKRTLSDQVDVALGRYYRHLMGADRISALLQKAELLKHKLLVDHAERVVQEAIRMAQQLNDLTMERKAQGLWMQLITDMSGQRFATYYPIWEIRMRELREQMQQEDELRGVSKQLFVMHRVIGDVQTEEERERLNALMEHPLLKQAPEGLAFHAARQYHDCHQHYHQLLLDHASALHHLLCIRRLWEAHPVIKHDRPDLYRAFLGQLFGQYFRMDRWAEAEEVYGLMGKMHLWSKEADVLYEAHLQIKGQLLSMNRMRAEEMRRELKRTDRLIAAEGDRIQASNFKTLAYNAAVLCFLLEQDKGAQRWLNRLDGHRHVVARTDLHRAGNYLRLMLHYDGYRLDVVDQTVKQQQRTEGHDSHGEALFSAPLQLVGRPSDKHVILGELLSTLDSLGPGKWIGKDEMQVWAQAHRNGTSRLQAFQGYARQSSAA